MNNSRNNNAPHCIGYAASFAPSCATCKRCGRSVECAKKVLENLALINKRFDVTDLMNQAQKFLDKNGVKRELIISQESTVSRFAETLTCKFDTPSSIENLSKRPKAIAKAITKKGINMALDAHYQTNSFSDSFKPTYMKQVQELVNAKSFTISQLKEVIASTGTMKELAVRNAASWVVTALMALNVIRKITEDTYVTLEQH